MVNGYSGVSGPTSANFPVFLAANYAVEFYTGNPSNYVTVTSPWNLNTNTVTITAWINPSRECSRLAANRL